MAGSPLKPPELSADGGVKAAFFRLHHMTPPTSKSTENAQADCDEAARLTRIFTKGKLVRSEMRRLRSHMTHCAPCRESYREAVETTASLSRFTVEERERQQVERHKRSLHAKVFGSRKPKGSRFPFRLRLILMPAIFIYLVTQITSLGPPPANVEVVDVQGKVTLSGTDIDPEVENLLVLPGRWLTTMANGRVWLDSGECRFQLSSETSVLLERARPLRLRMRHGYASVDGDLSIVTVIGLLKVTQGKGNVYLTDAGLRVEPESGEWVFLDRRGEHRMELGESVLLRP